jgi:hypothetical protein
MMPKWTNPHMATIYETLCFQVGVSVELTDMEIIISVDDGIQFHINRLYEIMTGGELENAIEFGTLIRRRIKKYREVIFWKLAEETSRRESNTYA